MDGRRASRGGGCCSLGTQRATMCTARLTQERVGELLRFRICRQEHAVGREHRRWLQTAYHTSVVAIGCTCVVRENVLIASIRSRGAAFRWLFLFVVLVPFAVRCISARLRIREESMTLMPKLGIELCSVAYDGTRQVDIFHEELVCVCGCCLGSTMTKRWRVCGGDVDGGMTGTLHRVGARACSLHL